MKALFLCVMMMLSCAVLAADVEKDVLEAPKKAPRVPWIVDKNWEEIKDLAHERDQPILIDFTATWCGPCKLLDVMVFTEKPVIEMLSDVVTFQADIDDPRHLALKTELNIEVVPTVVWLNKRGEEIDRFRSYVSSSQFIDIVNGWENNNTIDRTLSVRQMASPQDPTVLLDVARRQAERGNDRQAEVLYRRMMNLRHDAEPRLVARGMLGLAQAEYELGREATARHLARQVSNMYTRENVSGDVLAYR
ncbi:MAG: thioredoxin-like negative regulator of GroEL, partial [Candidatus Krumholzibacteriia bacterium]